MKLKHGACCLFRAAACGAALFTGAGVLVASDGSDSTAKNAKVMLMIDEKNLGSVPTSEIEALAAKAFLAQGLQVVDQEMTKANIKKDQVLLKMAGDNRGAASVGLQFGADVIIVGDAVAKPAASRIADTQIRTYQASVTLRAVRTDNSETIASVSEVGTAMGIDDVMGGSKALRVAGEKSIAQLVEAVSQKMGVGDPDDGSTRTLALTVGGVDQSWKVKAVRKNLEKTEGIRHVTQQSYNSGSATFSMDTTMPAHKLSEAILLNPPDGLKYQVLEVVRGKISLRAVTEK